MFWVSNPKTYNLSFEITDLLWLVIAPRSFHFLVIGSISLDNFNLIQLRLTLKVNQYELIHTFGCKSSVSFPPRALFLLRVFAVKSLWRKYNIYYTYCINETTLCIGSSTTWFYTFQLKITNNPELPNYRPPYISHKATISIFSLLINFLLTQK